MAAFGADADGANADGANTVWDADGAETGGADADGVDTDGTDTVLDADAPPSVAQVGGIDSPPSEVVEEECDHGNIEGMVCGFRTRLLLRTGSAANDSLKSSCLKCASQTVDHTDGFHDVVSVSRWIAVCHLRLSS